MDANKIIELDVDKEDKSTVDNRASAPEPQNKVLKVLLDYDNLQENGERLDFSVLSSILAHHDSIINNNYTKIEIRVYGGWFQKETQSRHAIAVKSSNPSNSFRYKFDNRMVTVYFKFAESLECSAIHTLKNTYRISPFSKKLNYGFIGYEHGCELKEAISIINSKRCSHSECRGNDNTISIEEQKLIDTMIVSDLIYLSNPNNESGDLCIISSDDDMIPGILTAIQNKEILHLWCRYQPATTYLSILNKNRNYFGNALRKK